MLIGDLVWAYGCRGLILDVYYGDHITEYHVFWFDYQFAETSWIPKRHVIKVC